MELVSSMPDHQTNFACQTALGNFSKTLVKKIDQKSVTLSFISYTSLSAEQIQKPGEDLDKTRAVSTQKVDQGDMDVDMIVPSHLAGLTQVFDFMSNYCSASEYYCISNQSPSIVPITT
jgi:hypothetical protein